jgi:hypothetical protein
MYADPDATVFARGGDCEMAADLGQNIRGLLKSKRVRSAAIFSLGLISVDLLMMVQWTFWDWWMSVSNIFGQ